MYKCAFSGVRCVPFGIAFLPNFMHTPQFLLPNPKLTRSITPGLVWAAGQAANDGKRELAGVKRERTGRAPGVTSLRRGFFGGPFLPVRPRLQKTHLPPHVHGFRGACLIHLGHVELSFMSVHSIKIAASIREWPRSIIQWNQPSSEVFCPRILSPSPYLLTEVVVLSSLTALLLLLFNNMPCDHSHIRKGRVANVIKDTKIPSLASETNVVVVHALIKHVNTAHIPDVIWNDWMSVNSLSLVGFSIAPHGPCALGRAGVNVVQDSNL